MKTISDFMPERHSEYEITDSEMITVLTKAVEYLLSIQKDYDNTSVYDGIK